MIQETLRRDVLIAITRMTDNAVTGRDQQNATIAALIEDVTPHLDSTVAAAVAGEGSKLKAICAPIRTRRNKTLVHSDRLVVIGSDDAPVLPGVTVATVDAALETIAGILNRVSVAFGLGTTFYDDVIHSGRVDSLVVHLRDAELFHEATRRSKRERVD